MAVLRPALGDLSLSLLQRILLTTDGTVTQVLEAYADEPMRVVILLQELGATAADGDLETPEGTTVMRRNVVLEGARSARNLLYAESLIVPDRIPPRVNEGLLSTDIPIGRLLAQNRVETFREVLRYGEENAGPAGCHFGVEPTHTLFFRTYRVVSAGLPMMVITEKFPAGSFVIV